MSYCALYSCLLLTKGEMGVRKFTSLYFWTWERVLRKIQGVLIQKAVIIEPLITASKWGLKWIPMRNNSHDLGHNPSASVPRNRWKVHLIGNAWNIINRPFDKILLFLKISKYLPRKCHSFKSTIQKSEEVMTFDPESFNNVFNYYFNSMWIMKRKCNNIKALWILITSYFPCKGLFIPP